MKPISLSSIESLRSAQQHFSDCYLVSTVSSLSRCENGKRFLQKNIQQDGTTFCIRFNNVNGKPEEYIITKEEADMLVLTDKYYNPIKVEHHPIIHALEVAMDRLLRKHPEKRSLGAKILNMNTWFSLEKFEYHSPSSFLEMFTGIKPISINEKGLRMNMKKNSNEVRQLFAKMDNQKDGFSFILGAGLRFFDNSLSDFHCHEITSVDNASQIVNYTEHRLGENSSMPFDWVIKNFKYICGYFDDMLAPKSEVLK